MADVTAKPGQNVWVQRTQSAAKMFYVHQTIIRQLHATLEALQAKAGRVDEEAVLLSNLRFDALRDLREVASSPSGARANSARKRSHADHSRSRSGKALRRAPCAQGGEGSVHLTSFTSDLSPFFAVLRELEPTLASYDDKKRHRISGMLWAAYKAAPIPATGSSEAASQEQSVSSMPILPSAAFAEGNSILFANATLPTPLIPPLQPQLQPPPPPLPSQMPQPLSVRSSLGIAETSTTSLSKVMNLSTLTTTPTTSQCIMKRPREVPTILWDDILRLRGLQLQLKENIKAIRKEIVLQIRRLNLVQEMNMVANHALQGSLASDPKKPMSAPNVDTGLRKKK
ncbi:unnamed protein product [Phytomonas sp. EM1]|nr:unnamed protein product [Phytomonas sp. EM1]|eukprot:CCW61645.1 unnamed protein product [Phytomonas sp. isolate EM1]